MYPLVGASAVILYKGKPPGHEGSHPAMKVIPDHSYECHPSIVDDPDDNDRSGGLLLITLEDAQTHLGGL